MVKRIYKWVRGLTQYQKLIARLEKESWSHYLDYNSRSTAFKVANRLNGIVVGKASLHKGVAPIYSVHWKKKKEGKNNGT